MASNGASGSLAGKDRMKISDLPAAAADVVLRKIRHPSQFIDHYTLQFNEDQTELGLGPRAIEPFALEPTKHFFPLVKVNKAEEKFSFELKPLKNPFFRQTRNFLSFSEDEQIVQWYHRVVKVKYHDLQSKGIHHLLQFMILPCLIDTNFLAALTSFWSVSTNTFHFKFGMMTPNLLDLAILFGLNPYGKIIDINLENDADEMYRTHYNFRHKSSYNAWVAEYMGGKESTVSDIEYIAFLLYWLSRFVVCNHQFKIDESLYPIAYYLVKGNAALKPLAMGRFVLAHLYGGLNRIISTNFVSWGGPLWMLQVWGYAYFETIRPRLVQSPEVPIHGLNFLCGDPPFGTLASYLHSFYHLDLKPSEQQTLRNLMERLPCGPSWLRTAMTSCESGKSRKFWKSVLNARDLPHRSCLGQVNKSTAGVELYNPHYAALQFGFKQHLPYPVHWSWNETFILRRAFRSLNDGETDFFVGAYMLSNFYIPQGIRHPTHLPKTLSVDPEFTKFWTKYMFKRPALEVIVSAFGSDATAVYGDADVQPFDLQANTETLVIAGQKRKQDVDSSIGTPKKGRNVSADIGESSQKILEAAPSQAIQVFVKAEPETMYTDIEQWADILVILPTIDENGECMANLEDFTAIETTEILSADTPAEVSEAHEGPIISALPVGIFANISEAHEDIPSTGGLSAEILTAAFEVLEDVTTDLPVTTHADELRETYVRSAEVSEPLLTPINAIPVAEQISNLSSSQRKKKESRKQKNPSTELLSSTPMEATAPIFRIPEDFGDFDFERFMAEVVVESATEFIPDLMPLDSMKAIQAKAVVDKVLDAVEPPSLGDDLDNLVNSLKCLQRAYRVGSQEYNKISTLLHGVPELVHKSNEAAKKFSIASKFLETNKLQNRAVEEEQKRLSALSAEGKKKLARVAELKQRIRDLKAQIRQCKTDLTPLSYLDRSKVEYDAGCQEWLNLLAELNFKKESESAERLNKVEAETTIIELQSQWAQLAKDNQL